MAVTTEPGLAGGVTRPRTRSTEITEEQWVGLLDAIEPSKTPMMSFAESEINLGAKEFKKNVDSYVSVKGAIGRADYEAAPATGTALSTDWTANVRIIGNIGQAFFQKWSVGWIASRVPKIHGMANIQAEGKRRALALMKLDQEVAMSSTDQTAQLDAGSGLGAIGAGYVALISSGLASAYTVSNFLMGRATDLHAAPASAFVTGTLSANHNRAQWMNVALALRQAALEDTDFMVFAGLNLNQSVSDLTNPTTVSGTSGLASAQSMAANQVRVYLRNETDNILGVSVDTIMTPNGRFFLAKTDWIGATTTSATTTAGLVTGFTGPTTAWISTTFRASAVFNRNPYAGHIVRKGNVFKMWGITPFTQELSQTGGGDDREVKSLMAWGVRNPILAGFMGFTAA